MSRLRLRHDTSSDPFDPIPFPSLESEWRREGDRSGKSPLAMDVGEAVDRAFARVDNAFAELERELESREPLQFRGAAGRWTDDDDGPWAA